MDEIDATLILCHTPYLGATTIRKAIDIFGSACEAVEAIRNKKCPFAIRTESYDSIVRAHDAPGWQDDRKRAEKENAALVAYTSPDFPEKLKQIADCPPLLYVKGSLKAMTKRAVAIVGTRNASHQAMHDAQRFAKVLAQNGLVVVSGLARGIDTAAHKASLITGATCAVIGSGLCDIYPKENIALANQIAQHDASCVISEFPMQLAPSRYTFPKRNRIISALSDAILLCEAPKKSGAMITMQYGQEHKKMLFALPGRAGSENSLGNNFLIKSKVATLVDHPEEILSALHHPIHFARKPQKTTISELQLTDDEQKIVRHLRNSELCLEELVGLNLLPVATLQAILIKLILKKIVLELPGKRYTLHLN